MTQIKREPFNARDFSSRKLIELVLDDRASDRLTLDQEALDSVVSELASRRHYLRELRQRGLLAPRASWHQPSLRISTDLARVRSPRSCKKRGLSRPLRNARQD